MAQEHKFYRTLQNIEQWGGWEEEREREGGRKERVGTWVCEAEVKDLRFPNLAVGSHP